LAGWRHAHGTQGIAQAVGALDKVIMGLFSGGAQIIAGTDAGIDNCPHGAYVPGLEALAMVGLPAAEILAAALAARAGPGPR
jgi:imidazolonepropionase-like amidohydrolase